MFAWLGKLFGFGSTWPSDIPRFYPDLSDDQLSHFLTEREYRRILRLPLVTILPFSSPNDEADEAALGMGLSRLMIRDLMLVPDLSVRGPEDTPALPIEVMKEQNDPYDRGCFVGGAIAGRDGDFQAEVEVFCRDRPTQRREVQGADIDELVRACNHAAAEALGVNVPEEVEEHWRFGRPPSSRALAEFGRLCFERGNPAATAQAAALWKKHRRFVLPLHLLDDDHLPARPLLVEGIQRDPYDAQLLFLLFCMVWDSTGPQPAAVQLLRRAIALSPGHGKAHMCAPHAANRHVDLLRHSELGYRLLPNNTFAVNNYVIYLQDSGAAPQKLIDLANEGIAKDPHDPGNYDRLVEGYCALGDYEQALNAANRLQRLYEPRMSERTRYCIEQNPQRAQLLRSGLWDPAAENRKMIKQLKARVR